MSAAVSWKPTFLVSGAWYDNAQRFATQEEAEASAYARFQVWTMPEGFGADPSPDPVNYARIDGADVAVSK